MLASLSKKGLDGLDERLRALEVFLLVKVCHALIPHLCGGNHAVFEHPVHVLCGFLLAAAGIAAHVIGIVVPRGGNALQRVFRAVPGAFLLLRHVFSISPFG